MAQSLGAGLDTYELDSQWMAFRLVWRKIGMERGGMMYDQIAGTSTSTSISELDKDGKGKASVVSTRKEMREREDKREWIMSMCHDTVMSSHVLAFKSPPVVLYTVLHSKNYTILGQFIWE